MKIVNTNGASSLVHPVHGAVTAGTDGTFEVSPELAAELLAFPFWTTEDAHLAEVERIDLADLHDPAAAAEVLALWREDRAVLRAGGTLEATDPTPALWAPDARTVVWCGLHLRGDAAGIAEFTQIAAEVYGLQVRAVQAAADAAVAADKAKEGTK